MFYLLKGAVFSFSCVLCFVFCFVFCFLLAWDVSLDWQLVQHIAMDFLDGWWQRVFDKPFLRASTISPTGTKHGWLYGFFFFFFSFSLGGVVSSETIASVIWSHTGPAFSCLLVPFAHYGKGGCRI